MKKPHNQSFVIAILLLMIMSSCSKDLPRMVTSEEMKIKSEWVQSHLLNPDACIPFSFLYDGKASAVFLKSWERKTETRQIDTTRIQHDQVWTNPQTGLEIRCSAVEYIDYPVVEWTAYFKNTGRKNTLVLNDIQGLDVVFQQKGDGDFVLHGIKGDFCTADSYEPYNDTLAPGSVKKFSPSESGKSSDGPEGWPYYNLQMHGKGVIIAVGWPGQWASSFTRDAAGGLTVKAGQQLTNCYLKPGEEIRTPLIALLFWQKTNVVDAQNLWRRYYLAHIIPHADGKPQQPTLQIQVGGAGKDTSSVNSFLRAGIKPDICWRDAGWYPKDNGPYKGNDSWLNTGTWEIDSTRYPETFRPYSDWVHKHGMNFLLWFEPERVGDPGSWLARNHQNWLLPGTSHGALLDEGNPAAREWLIDHIDGMIKTQGIDWYREDMNGGGPLPAWRKNDTPDRQGITENRYIQGHLAYWDELKRRNPHLRIDACASGGRRNDLETMKRAVPLLRSDFQWIGMENVIRGNQGQTYGLSSWLPFQGTGAYFYDTYSMRSFYMAGFGMGNLTPENMAAQHQAYTECSKVAPAMLFGDYYPLTPYSVNIDQWIAWQFDRPEGGTGIIQAFRRDSCAEATKTFHLEGLIPDAQYEITSFDTEIPVIHKGNELMEEGLKITIGDKPGAAIIKYQAIGIAN
jgi:alpha-galactosidase